MFKLKSKAILAVMLMFGITIIMSCDKQNEGLSVKSAEAEIFEISNPKNPFDSLGVIHNNKCISFINDNEVAIRSNLLNDSDVFEYFSINTQLRNIVRDYFDMANYTYAQFENSNDSIFTVYSSSIKCYTDLVEIVKDSSLTFDKKINTFINFENEISDNNNNLYKDIDEENIEEIKNSLLIGCAIGRYSLYLWSDTEDGGLGYYNYLITNTTNTKGSNPPPWVTEDIWGALTGAWFTGNPFVALGGGVASSIVSVIRTEFDD